jgi:hypothetical protein
MHFQSRTLLAVAFLVALAASPAIAWGATCCNTDIGTGRGSNNGSGGSGAPGPIAGAGLGYLVLAGGYYVVRRWRKQNTGE